MTTSGFWTALILAASLFAASPVPGQASGPAADPTRAGEAMAKPVESANAAWWGFDERDATAALQSAINSKAAKVIVPNTGKPWIVDKITLRSNLELILEPGVEVQAKAGAFRGLNDSLFTGTDLDNLIIRGGAGSILRMRKNDYVAEPYSKSEWRMVLALRGCRNVTISDLTLADSGGDGIYLGTLTPDRPACTDVVIRNVVCDNNLRQGISIISGQNILIENCTFKNTSGTAPAAGVDLEPNKPRNRLENITIRNCVAENNAGAGFFVYARPLKNDQTISVLFDRCMVKGGNGQGLVAGALMDDGAGGLIEFRDCTVENTAMAGAYVYDKSAAGATVKFTRCTFRDVARKTSGEESPEAARTNKNAPLPSAPLLIYLRRPNLTSNFGGVEFADCTVIDDRKRPALVVAEKESALGVSEVRGTITVHNPHGAQVELGANARKSDIKAVAAP